MIPFPTQTQVSQVASLQPGFGHAKQQSCAGFGVTVGTCAATAPATNKTMSANQRINVAASGSCSQWAKGCVLVVAWAGD